MTIPDYLEAILEELQKINGKKTWQPSPEEIRILTEEPNAKVERVGKKGKGNKAQSHGNEKIETKSL